MLFQQTLAALAAVGLVAALPYSEPISKRGVDFAFAQTPVRGVNIGGWLVLEPWITPSIFEALDQSLGIVDEWTLTQQLGTDAALGILQPHWNSWCTLTDFQKIAASGFNTVRIPIGYWAFQLVDGEPYTSGAAPYLDSAIDWARQTGLKVWIDLHGAPGSQNGFDNSGHKEAYPEWQQGDTVQQTLSILQMISDKYAQSQYQDVVVAIELLNEPLSSELNFDELKTFYQNGYDQVRETSDTPVVIHDGFVSAGSWNGFLTPSDNNAQFVIVDHHEYQVFTDDFVAMQNWQHRQYVCNNAPEYGGADKWVVVGEWTAAETDCAKYLNGYDIGARYDGTYPNSTYVGSCADMDLIANWSQDMRDDVRGYIEAQLETYEQKAQGWIFWNFKTEQAQEWDAFALIDAGLFPQPLTDRQFSAICSN